jgi:hypothetical protein
MFHKLFSFISVLTKLSKLQTLLLMYDKHLKQSLIVLLQDYPIYSSNVVLALNSCSLICFTNIFEVTVIFMCCVHHFTLPFQFIPSGLSIHICNPPVMSTDFLHFILLMLIII